MNEHLARNVVKALLEKGVVECCVSPGARCTPLYPILKQTVALKKYYWFEERSSAFFALGRSKATNRPVAVITTSGTAAGELLPATMEAYYTGIPLLLVTADRPRRFRGSGAPQAAEQIGLYSCYTTVTCDVAHDEPIDFTSWDCRSPAHLNVCFEEPFPGGIRQAQPMKFSEPSHDLICTTLPYGRSKPYDFAEAQNNLSHFLKKVDSPFVIVSTLPEEAREPVAQFLLQLNAPVFLEGISGLREDARLQPLRITQTEKLLEMAKRSNYRIDGILRIGGVPTLRLWRDIQELNGAIPVCSFNEVPFSGISWGSINCVTLPHFFCHYEVKRAYSGCNDWYQNDQLYSHHLDQLIVEEPFAEPALVRTLSEKIAVGSRVYLGNSLPIREWDVAATSEFKQFQIAASRGQSGIDGQISTFLGWSKPNVHNWAILGDLTTLYDMAGPWILSQMEEQNITIVVINNAGGQIFSKVSRDKEFLHTHDLSFHSLAEFWKMGYERWTAIPDEVSGGQHRLIELVPDNCASDRFWEKLNMFFNIQPQRAQRTQR